MVRQHPRLAATPCRRARHPPPAEICFVHPFHALNNNLRRQTFTLFFFSYRPIYTVTSRNASDVTKRAFATSLRFVNTRLAFYQLYVITISQQLNNVLVPIIAHRPMRTEGELSDSLPYKRYAVRLRISKPY